ncbi:MAG TPA: hypothetical protein V6C65_02385 [Allocoleopsis sp.]
MKHFGKIGLTCSVIAACGLLGSSLGSVSPAQSQTVQSAPFQIAATPVTYMTVIDADHIVVQITEGEFLFHGWLERTSGNMFVGEDEQVRVMYDRDTSQLVVINVQTGDEFYNYTFSITNEGAL